jgi:hypothetical protein
MNEIIQKHLSELSFEKKQTHFLQIKSDITFNRFDTHHKHKKIKK